MAGFHVQNPDPKAHKYFAEHITKAYQALTDEVSRQNYEKYGHPDGPQVGAGERSKGRPGVQWRCALRLEGPSFLASGLVPEWEAQEGRYDCTGE